VRRYFITGTDTEIGKTFVTCGLLHAFRIRGFNAAPMKPIAAGATPRNCVLANEDVHELIAAYGKPISPSLVNPYCFREAIAPHIASAHDGVTVDLQTVQAAFTEIAGTHHTVLVEGAGGFLVPLSDTESMSMIPQTLDLAVVLVVGMRLGCLNHALATAEVIRARGLALAGWIANTVDPNMACFDENIQSLKLRLNAPCLGVVPRIQESDISRRAAVTSNYLDIEPLLAS